MTFTRTAAGIANYSLFFGVEILVFVEGKPEAERGQGELVPDECFYENLLKSVLPGTAAKVKCVGNCDDVIANVRNLDPGARVFGIVDRDAEGILFSNCGLSNRIALTYGYSWESDLWSMNTVELVARRLALPTESGLRRVKKSVASCSRWLAIVCMLDFAMRVDGAPLFSKNRKSCGIGFDAKLGCGMPRSEFRRLIAKFRTSSAASCSVARFVLELTKTFPRERLIQGHIKHNLVCNVIADEFRVRTRAGLPYAAILNAALGLMGESPKECLEVEAYRYYQEELGRLAGER